MSTTVPWNPVPSYPVYPNYQPEQPVYHYHYNYYYPFTEAVATKNAPTPIKVGDWVYSSHISNLVIGEVEEVFPTSLLVKGLFRGEVGTGWSLSIDDAVKIERLT